MVIRSNIVHLIPQSINLVHPLQTAPRIQKKLALSLILRLSPIYCFFPIDLPALIISSTNSSLDAMMDPKCKNCFLTQ